MAVTLGDLKHGVSVTCQIQGEVIDDAKISIDDDGRYHICQNVQNGHDAKNKLGYDLSWTFNYPVDDNSLQIKLKNVSVTNLELKEGTNKMSIENITSKIKLLALSKEDRALRNGGLVDECGTITQTGKDVLWSILLTDHKIKLAGLVADVEAEEKSAKKGK